MKNLMENLIALQDFEFHIRRRSPEAVQQIEALRTELPESLLNRFDRSIARGRKPVAAAHNGVCGECHLKLPVGVVAALAFGEGIQHCGNCGRFLYLPEDKPVLAPPAPGPAKTTPARAARRDQEAPAQVR